MNFKKFWIVCSFLLLFSKAFAGDNSPHQYNFFVGNFDFSDHKQSAILAGFQHQNENLERNTLIGTSHQSLVVLLQRIQQHTFIQVLNGM